jgi:hypothetical protein
VVKVGNNISTSLILNTGAPEGCVLSLFTHDSVTMHASNSIINSSRLDYKQRRDMATHREECGVRKTTSHSVRKEMIVEFRKEQREHSLILIDGTAEEKVESLKFLGVHIKDKLKWSTHTDSVVKKVQQCFFNLRSLKKCGLSPKTLTNFYKCTIESILLGCITTWYNCTAHNRKALQRVVRSAQCITGANYLLSRTPTAPNVTGMPKISSRPTTTRATACSPPEGEVSTGASKLRPRD